MQVSSNSLQVQIPFEGEKYSGNINISILRDTKTPAVFIRVVGERISLECFQGQYSESLKAIFGSDIITNRQELRDLTSIFGSKTGMSNYGGGDPEEEEKIRRRIEKDASRPYQGDVFTGFSVTDNENGKIIGRVSLGSGYEPGESQSGLIIEEGYKGKGYGKEAICLAVSLAFIFYQQKFQVGDNGEKAPVNRFTATALDTNEKSVKLIAQVGLKYMRPLTPEENYSDEPRSLYGVQGSEVDDLIEKLIDKSKLAWKVTDIS